MNINSASRPEMGRYSYVHVQANLVSLSRASMYINQFVSIISEIRSIIWESGIILA